MPVMIAPADAGKAAAGPGSKLVLCAGSAGMVQQQLAMQLGANPPYCMSAPQPGQTVPVPMPACAGPCICAAMAALELI
jgi:hypothetical protein